MNKKYKLRLPIGKLFDFFGVDNTEYNITQNLNRDVFIKTPRNEFQRINELIKKQGHVNLYQFDNDIQIKCDENHLVKSNNKFTFIKNCDEIETVNGKTKCISTQYIGYKDVYDISMDSPHEYITSNGIICHNTTIGKILANEIDCDCLYINASDENNVETIRNKVKGFASTLSFKKWKIIFLDEFSEMTPQAQMILRYIMEEYSESSRFILTANYIEKIIEPIQSRCQIFNVVPPSKKDIAIHVHNILSIENVIYTPSDLKVLIDSTYPDIRKLINECQKQSINGELKLDKKSVIESNYALKVIDILKNTKSAGSSLAEIRQLFADSKVTDFTPLYQLLYEQVDSYSKGKSAEVILKITEFEYQSQLRVIKELSAAALIISILEIIA
jgi:replication factor C small subunit